MKTVYKKIFSILLLFFIFVTFVGCSEEEYSLTINVTNEIYVDEVANYEVLIQPSNEKLADYNYSSSDDEVLLVELGTIKGISEGNADIIISAVIDNKKIETKVNVVVKEEEIKNSLEVKLSSELGVNKYASLIVTEVNGKNPINNYEVFIEDNTIVKYENNYLYGLKVGKTTATIVGSYEGQNLTGSVEINVLSDSEVSFLEINVDKTIYVGSFIDVEIKLMPENVKLNDFTIESSDKKILNYFAKDKLIEALSAGEVTLTVKAQYKNFEYIDIIQVEVLPELSLNIVAAEEFVENQASEFKVYLMPDNVEITEYNCVSSNKSVFTVTPGVITPLSYGTARLSVSYDYDGVTVNGSIEIKVDKYIPKSLKTNINELMFIDEEITVDVTLYPEIIKIDNYQIIVENENVIKVEDNKLIALSKGSSKVTIKYEDVTVEYNITVEELTGIKLEIVNELDENQVVYYKVLALPSNLEIKNHAYNSSNNDILINNNAIFASKACESVITVTYQYKGTTYTETANVKANKIVHPVERIYITSRNALFKDTSDFVTVSVYPKKATGKFNYYSSDENIIAFNGAEMFAINEGKCVIKVELIDNPDVYCEKEIYVFESRVSYELIDGIHNGNQLIARYMEASIIEYNELAMGVKQTTLNGATSTQLPGDVDGYKGLEADIVLDEYYSQQVNLLEIPSNKELKIIPWANLDGHVWTLTTVRTLINNYEKNNPGYKVIAAVNGDFFDINGGKNLPYSTTGENISNGEFYKTSNGFGVGGGTIGFTNDGSNNTLKGIVNAEVTPYYVLSVYDDEGNIVKEFRIENYNKEVANQSAVYYGTYNTEKKYEGITPIGSHIFMIENAELALPNDAYGDFYGMGVITSEGPGYLEKGQFAIQTYNQEIIDYLKVGMKVRVQREYTGEFASVVSSTGYNACLFDETHDINYTDGNILNRAPRTVIGMREDGTIVMLVVDGRQGIKGMYGCDGYELSAIMKAYGCVKAYNVDGGGSSTMIIRTEEGLKVLNSPSDGKERADGNCILICTYDPYYNVEATDITTNSATVNVKCNNSEYEGVPAYLEMNNKFYEVIDNKVELSNLVHNTTYSYRIYYKENDELIPTQNVGSFTTQKTGFKYLGLTISETDDKFIFNVYYDDVDNASNIYEGMLTINGLIAYLNNGEFEMSKAIFGEYIDSLSLEYYYYENGEKITITDENPIVFMQ